MARFTSLFGGSGSHPLLIVPIALLLLLSGGSSEAIGRCASLTQIAGKDGYRAIDDGSLSRLQFEEAEAVCTRLFEKTGDPSAGLSAAKAGFHLGRYDQALRWVERLKGTTSEAGVWGVAAGVHERRGDRKLERTARERVLGFRLAAQEHREAARAYYMLFRLAFREANLRDQIESLRLTYEEAAKAGSRDYQILAIRAIISPLLEIGDLNSARRALRAATELTPANRKRTGSELASSEGIIHLREGQTAIAIASFKQALEIAGGDADAAVLRAIYLNLLEASLRAGNLNDAEAYLKSAWGRLDARREITSALYYYRALLARTRGQYKVARDTALTALANHPVPDWGWQLEYELGRAAEALGDMVAAAAAFSRSAGHVEELRRSVDFDDFKLWLLDRRREPYEALFRLHARAGDSRRAIEVFERAKARTFLDAFIRTTSTTSGETDDISLLHESTERLDGLQALLPAMSKSPAAEVRSIDTVLAGGGHRNVLMYFEAGDELWLVTLLGGRRQLHQLPMSATHIRSLVERFLASPDDPATAATLGDAILPPAALPQPGATLQIVSDGSLGQLPFASLRPRGRFLVRDYMISYVPSLNALYAADTRAPITYGRPVVLGDPRGDLPAAARESADVATRLGVSAFVGRAATRAQLRQAAHARVLHLATHTGLGPRGPWAMMADGDIDAAVLMSQSTQPRLTVLATCASAAKEGGDMWGSLASAFLAAGSQAVLASLWSVDDKDAREFITRFYDEGGADESAAALARTQRAFLDSGRPASFWAPYVHFGASRIARHQ